MEVPDTDTAVFTQMEQTGLEGWDDAENETVQDVPLVRRDVELASGGTAALYALDTGEEPSTGTDELTSVSAELVLNSAAIQLGEYGTVRELAESELYHWADASEFDRIQYTQPLQISEKRFAVHLLLDNAGGRDGAAGGLHRPGRRRPGGPPVALHTGCAGGGRLARI